MGDRRWVAALKHPPFIVCVLLLASASVLAGPVAKWAKLVLRKDPVPLRKKLAELDRTSLEGYRFIGATTLDPSTIAALGTDEYIDWEFADESTKRSDPLHRVRAFVAYYTGKPGLVPHVAEVCQTAAGLELVQAGNVTLEVDVGRGAPMQVPARTVTFAKSAVYDHDRPTVVYTFHCNGEFLADRTSVRARLANPFFKGAYFCKIELSFRAQGTATASAGREDTIAAAEKFLGRLLPVLLDDHLPDWDAVEQGQGTAS